MQSHDNRAAIETALYQPLDPRLHRLLTERVELYRAAGVLDLTHVLVIEPGDTEQAIIDAIGMSPLVNPIDCIRYGAAGFQPYWDGPVCRHDGWYELVITVGDSGFAFILLIANAEGVLPELLDLCCAHASA